MSSLDTNIKLELALNILLLIAFLSLNSTLSITNRWALGLYGFSFPLLLTGCHMLFSFCCLLPVMLCAPFRAQHTGCIRKHWKAIVAIGICMAVNVSLNNLSLVLITLTMNQIIRYSQNTGQCRHNLVFCYLGTCFLCRSSIPVVTALMSILIEGVMPTTPESASLVLLSSGVMLVMWQGAVSGSTPGILVCVVATLCNGVTMCTIGRVMSDKVHVLCLIFYTAPVSCATLTPFFLLKEVKIDIQAFLFRLPSCKDESTEHIFLVKACVTRAHPSSCFVPL